MMCKLILDEKEDRAFIERCERNHVKWIDLFQDAVAKVVRDRMQAFMADPKYDTRESKFLDAQGGAFEGEVNPNMMVRPM